MLSADVALLVIGGSAVAGFVSGLAGFAFGLVAMVFWAWTLPPQAIGPMLGVGSLVGQALTVHTVRAQIRPKLIGPFIAGGFIGVPIGAALLPIIDPEGFRIGVGVLLIVYCGLMLAAKNLPAVTIGGAWADGGIGVIGGVLGGIAGLVGPAPTVWCMLRGHSKDTQRAICQSFFIAMQSLTLVTYALTGLIGRQTLVLFAWMLPSSLLFAWLGSRLYVRLSDTAFRRVLLMLLFASGVALLGSSLAHALHTH
ncbi:sulfite exporter TauE/SafE family protein [Paraburkholderia sp. C35]|uniref:sulfite exporter TauE/SafE family protein n=1 Tax=Paraburkholderia sp. C35 TaxID=2126993 RepID=UPI000D68E041|nr:sulfite exporter TauE/SafE family protein [Paraburkholderia sp. C35]